MGLHFGIVPQADQSRNPIVEAIDRHSGNPALRKAAKYGSPKPGALKGSPLRNAEIVNHGSSFITSARAASACARWSSMMCAAACSRSRPGFGWRALCTISMTF